MMGFLTPAFLAGLVALAVPILVHLTHRPRSETIAFPSLMFLQRIPYRSVRRQSLRHWLLFALRSAAFVLLALAFARPFFGRESRAVAALGGARARVVLLDRSYSMGYRGSWPRAVAAARHALSELGPDDRATLVLFDRVPESSGDPTADRSALLARLDAARPGFGVTRFAPALRMAQETLEGSRLPRREIVLVTDFQKTGWDGGDGLRIPRSTTLSWVDVSTRDPSNVAITGVDLGRDYLSGRERVVPAARLVNKGGREVPDLEVALEVDGRVVRQQHTRLGPNTSTVVAFDPFPLPPAPARATVRCTPDALPVDDAFHLVLAPGGDVPVLVLESGVAAARSLYLRRALAVGHRPRFQVDVKDVSEVRPEDFAARPVVVLNESAPPAGAAGRRLREMVDEGGGLLVVLGDRSMPRAWEGDAATLLPGAFGAPVDRSADRGASLAYVDDTSPVFALFRGPHSGDFSSARFFRYRPLEAKDGVLARFDDGRVALAEKAVGKGRVFVWTTSLDTSWNDLALQALEAVIQKYGGDRNRLYLTGLSIGGGGTWTIASQHPDLFAPARGRPRRVARLAHRRRDAGPFRRGLAAEGRSGGHRPFRPEVAAGGGAPRPRPRPSRVLRGPLARGGRARRSGGGERGPGGVRSGRAGSRGAGERGHGWPGRGARDVDPPLDHRGSGGPPGALALRPGRGARPPRDGDGPFEPPGGHTSGGQVREP